jgi:hypothetical protein
MRSCIDHLLRAAIKIHQALTQSKPVGVLPMIPPSLGDRVHRSFYRWHRTTTRGWKEASRIARRRLDDDLHYLVHEIDRLRHAMDQQHHPVPTVSLRDIIDDLRSLDEEFDRVEINLRERTLSITTEPIVLEGIEFGAFTLVLDWTKLHDHWPYRVVANDPHPASSNEDVTHPHVSSEKLCEGNAHLAIRQALQEGRLFDFFVILRQILRTYNPNSPYVSIENWHGVPCQDCGSLTGDEYDVCHSCESMICFDCSNSCDDCGERCCGRCVNVCRGCDRSFCPHCLRDCEACGDTFCQECLIENDTCQACFEVQEKEADASLHPDGMGQAPLSP